LLGFLLYFILFFVIDFQMFSSPIFFHSLFPVLIRYYFLLVSIELHLIQFPVQKNIFSTSNYTRVLAKQ
jgi:hypothetical protein